VPLVTRLVLLLLLLLLTDIPIIRNPQTLFQLIQRRMLLLL
jgi:hypothetical protein